MSKAQFCAFLIDLRVKITFGVLVNIGVSSYNNEDILVLNLFQKKIELWDI